MLITASRLSLPFDVYRIESTEMFPLASMAGTVEYNKKENRS
jgi:hypothetical protein